MSYEIGDDGHITAAVMFTKRSRYEASLEKHSTPNTAVSIRWMAWPGTPVSLVSLVSLVSFSPLYSALCVLWSGQRRALGLSSASA